MLEPAVLKLSKFGIKAFATRRYWLLRPMLPFPDLLDQENAMRKSLTEQVQNRNLSLLERNQQITKFHSKMLVEEQSRLLANPTTDAKVPAAATQ